MLFKGATTLTANTLNQAIDRAMAVIEKPLHENFFDTANYAESVLSYSLPSVRVFF